MAGACRVQPVGWTGPMTDSVSQQLLPASLLLVPMEVPGTVGLWLHGLSVSVEAGLSGAVGARG